MIKKILYNFMLVCALLCIACSGSSSGSNSSSNVLTPPVLLTASSQLYPDAVVIQWKSVKGAEGYRVYRSESPDDGFSLVYQTGQNTLLDDELKPGTPYYYKLKSFNYNKESGFSDTISGRTDYISCPANVNAGDGTYENKIEISWEKTIGAAGYRIYRKTGGIESFELYAETQDTVYTDTQVLTDCVYAYTVSAVDTDGHESQQSSFDTGFADTAGLDKLEAPAGVNATNGLYEHRVDISWQQVDGAEVYYLYRTRGQSRETELIKTTSGTEYSDTTAIAGTIYYYTVKAYKVNSGLGDASAYNSGFCQSSPDQVSFIIDGKLYTATIYSFKEEIPEASTYIANWNNELKGDYSGPKGTTEYGNGFLNRFTICAKFAESLDSGIVQLVGTYDIENSNYDVVLSVSHDPGNLVDGFSLTANGTVSLPQLTSVVAGEHLCLNINIPFRILSASGNISPSTGIQAVTLNAKIVTGIDQDTGNVTVSCALANQSSVSSDTVIEIEFTGADGLPVVMDTSIADLYLNNLKVAGTWNAEGTILSYDTTGQLNGSDTIVVDVPDSHLSSEGTNILPFTFSYRTRPGYVSIPAYLVASDGLYVDKIIINWQQMNGDYLYDVYRSASPDGAYSLIAQSLPVSTFTDKTTGAGEYYYKIRVFDQDTVQYSELSGYEAGSLATISEIGTDHYYTLDSEGAEVQWLQCDVEEGGSYFVYWDDVSEGSGQYTADIYVSGYYGSPGDLYTYFSFISNGYYEPQAVTAQGTTLFIKVELQDTAAGSQYGVMVSKHQAVSEPQNVNAGDGVNDQVITVTWDSVADAERYLVYRSQDRFQNYELVGSTDIISYIDRYDQENNGSIAKGTIYYYKVRAVSSNGSLSPYSTSDSGFTSIDISSADVIETSQLAVWQTGYLEVETNQLLYRIPVQNGEKYSIEWDDAIAGTGAYTADIKVSALLQNSEVFFTGIDEGYDSSRAEITINNDGTLVILVQPYSLYGTGSYAIKVTKL